MKNELSGSEAVYGFCAWLTTRKEKTVMSSSDECGCIAELVKEFCEVNKLTEPRDLWSDLLTHPKEEKGCGKCLYTYDGERVCDHNHCKNLKKAV